MINDYKNWIKSKHELLHHLEHHDSIILGKVENVINTLNYIAKLKEEEMNEDYSVIFDCGYSYIYQVVSDIELYLDKYFNNNMHQFLKYELLINYSLHKYKQLIQCTKNLEISLHLHISTHKCSLEGHPTG